MTAKALLPEPGIVAALRRRGRGGDGLLLLLGAVGVQRKTILAVVNNLLALVHVLFLLRLSDLLLLGAGLGPVVLEVQQPAAIGAHRALPVDKQRGAERGSQRQREDRPATVLNTRTERERDDRARARGALDLGGHGGVGGLELAEGGVGL